MQRVLSTTNGLSDSLIKPLSWKLAKNVVIRGEHKLANKWSLTLYRVIKQVRDLHGYVTAPCESDGPERVLHRDLLLPCGFLPPTAGELQTEPKRPARKAGGSRYNSVTDNNTSGDEECEENQFECEGQNYVIDYCYPAVNMSTTEEDGEMDGLQQSVETTAST